MALMMMDAGKDPSQPTLMSVLKSEMEKESKQMEADQNVAKQTEKNALAAV